MPSHRSQPVRADRGRRTLRSVKVMRPERLIDTADWQRQMNHHLRAESVAGAEELHRRVRGGEAIVVRVTDPHSRACHPFLGRNVAIDLVRPWTGMAARRWL